MNYNPAVHGAPLTEDELADLRRQSEERRERLKDRLHDKYIVVRTDGRDEPGEKHDGCHYFVLDLTHDRHARVALGTYLESCQAERPQLATDLARLLLELGEEEQA